MDTKTSLPSTPARNDAPALLDWITTVFRLDPQRPVTRVIRQGADHELHLTLVRHEAPAIRFNPESLIFNRAKLIPTLGPQRRSPGDADQGETPMFTPPECATVHHVLSMAVTCDEAIMQEDQTKAMIVAYLHAADAIEGFTIKTTEADLHEALRELAVAYGPAYLIDVHSYRHAIPATPLRKAAKLFLDEPMPWHELTARMSSAGWTRVPLQAHKIGSEGKREHHLALVVYTGFPPTDGQDTAFNTTDVEVVGR